jgi:hypothetical protein
LPDIRVRSIPLPPAFVMRFSSSPSARGRTPTTRHCAVQEQRRNVPAL